MSTEHAPEAPDVETFRKVLESCGLDDTLAPHQSIRPTLTNAPAPAAAFSTLPILKLDESTQPQLKLGPTIGEGGMGLVRSAHQLSLRRDVAVKTLREGVTDDGARASLIHEALVTGSLEHPNVMPVYTLGQGTDGAPAIVMKRIEGVSWAECLRDMSLAPGYEGDDPLEWHLAIFAQVCLAAHFAHSRGIVHRDIKPDNVMVGEFGEVYLLDWGIAACFDVQQRADLNDVASSTGICGTPQYMAPEMTTESSESIGPRTDVYLLGATLHHVITGEPPHRGSTVFEVMVRAFESDPPELPGVPDALAALCRQAMARDPNHRFDSADALRRAVLEFKRHQSSVMLANEAQNRLEELKEERANGQDETRIRSLYGECRFGFSQSLRVWDDNQQAIEGLEDTIRTMLHWEASNENLGAAEALLAELTHPAESETQALERLRAHLREREDEILQLRELRDEVDISRGASRRAIGGVIGLLFFTFMPLSVEFAIRLDIVELSPAIYFWHGFSVPVLLGLVVFVLRSALWSNEANRRVVRMLLAYGVWTPAFRLTAWGSGLDVMQALPLEVATYSIIFAGIAILSNSAAVVGVVVYIAAALVATQAPDWTFIATAIANFLALGSLALSWARQGALEDSGFLRTPDQQ